MTILRELKLQTINGNLHLIQRPIKKVNSIIDPARIWSISELIEITGHKIIDLTSEIPFKTGSMLILKYVFNIESIEYGRIGVRFSNDLEKYVSFKYNINEQTYEFDRHHSGNVTFNSRFSNPLPCINRISNSNLNIC